MTGAEVERIRAAAIERGRAERRSQGIPAQIDAPELTARLAGLLKSETPPRATQAKTGFRKGRNTTDNQSVGC